MNLFAIVLAAAMATAAPHAHSMMHSNVMHTKHMHGAMKSHSMMKSNAMHTKMKTKAHGHMMMTSPTSKPQA